MALIVLFALVAAGLVLLRQGCRGHFVGTTPHCRNCGYNLTALASSECPECGQIITDGAILFGEHQRHPKQIATGVFFIALGLLFVIAGSRQWLPGVNWYTYKPTFWVIADTRSLDVRLATKAYRELKSRLTDETLSDNQCCKAAETALAELTSLTPRGALTEHVDLLDALRQASKLSSDQETRFFENIARGQLEARPVVAPGMHVPIVRMLTAQTGTWTDLWVELASAEPGFSPLPLTKDYKKVNRRRSGSDTHYTALRAPGPGVHEIYAPLRIRVYEGTGTDPNRSRLLHETEKVLSAKVNVLSQEPPDFIRLVTTPDLEQAVRASVQVEKLEWSPYRPNSLDVRYQFSAPPIALAFKVTILSNGKEVGSKKLTIPRGCVTSYTIPRGCVTSYTSFIDTKGTDVDKVDVVLTPDTEAAKQTIDITEIWGKPIAFEKLKITRPSSRPSSQPGE